MIFSHSRSGPVATAQFDVPAAGRAVATDALGSFQSIWSTHHGRDVRRG